MSTRYRAIRMSTMLFLLAFILGAGVNRATVLQASGAPDIRLMAPDRNEAFPYESLNVVINLIGNFTADTEVVLKVYGNASSLSLPPTSPPTNQMATNVVLQNGDLRVTIPISQWTRVYGSKPQTLSAIVATNSAGTDTYYFSVTKYISSPVYYRGGLP